MRIAVTGTPGTGKTTASELVESNLDVIHLNDLVQSEGLTTGTDEERNSLVADIDAVAAQLSKKDDILVESHLAHYLEADRIVVLRCHPEELKHRLLERGESERKAEENAEAEALDVILSETADHHGIGSVYEIDTTDRNPAEVAGEIEAVIEDERPAAAGTVDFTEYL